jgi:excisionase family DNA binding protein
MVTVQHIAQQLAVSKRTVRRWIADGKLVSHRIGKNSVRVDASSVMHLIATTDSAVADGNAHVKNNVILFQPRLLRQRGRKQVWTGLVDGQEVDLGTSDRTEAVQALTKVSDESSQQARKPWSVYYDQARKCFGLKYYDRSGQRRHHRIPTSVQSEQQATEYAGRFYSETVGAPIKGPPRLSAPQIPRNVTLEQFGQLWTSGKLAELFPDHVRVKATASDDEARLRLYVYPVVGGHRLADFSGESGLQLVERVRDKLSLVSSKLSRSSRRQILQAINRLLTLAVYPAKLVSAHPLPKGFLPKVGTSKGKGYVYPSEDRLLMACQTVPLLYRLFYGLLIREGFRVSELLTLSWNAIDLERGVVTLDTNKTEDRRAWALDPGVAEALRRWRARLPNKLPGTTSILTGPNGSKIDQFNAARLLRKYLQEAGVNRPQLFEHGETRVQLRAHDLRASFVTTSLALGRSETWVTDRTGHKSSQMIYTYKRAARTHAELSLGGFEPLQEAIPELR